jgi:hypothetical protein
MPIAFGMGALGALLGVWIAWSQSAVVLTVLPLLFGLIGGAGGYSLLKMDLSKPSNQGKIKLIGVGLGSLCLSCLIFMVVAIVSRPALQNLINKPNFDVANSQAPLSSLMMRARLEALGASEAEMRNILKPKPTDVSDYMGLFPEVVSAAETYISAYEGLPAGDRTIFDGRNGRDEPRSIYVACRMFILEHRALSPNGAALTAQTADLLMEYLGRLSPSSRSDNVPREIQDVLLKNETFTIAKAKLIYAVNSLQTAQSRFASEREREIGDIDATLQVLANARKNPALNRPETVKVAMGARNEL